MDTAGLRLASGLAAALGWLLGIAWQLQQAEPGWLFGACAAGLGGPLAALAVTRARRLRALGLAVALACLGAAAGHGWAQARALLRLADALPAALEGRDAWVQGVVAELPRQGGQGLQFVFAVEAATPLPMDGGAALPLQLPPRLWVAWWHARDDGGLPALPPPVLRPGQRWLLPLRLRAPHGAMNPGGFDLELWAFERRLQGFASVRQAADAPPPRLLGQTAAHPVERARQAVRDAIERQVPEPRAAGVLAALAVGDQAAIDRADWALFRDTGVAHLMSISGLHVTMFAWLAAALVAALWRRWPGAPRRLPAVTAARWGGLALAAAYALLAGWGVPAQRTVWTLAAVALLRAGGLHWPMPMLLLAAAVVVTVADPWALLQPGFWLSFAAVALLVASEPLQGPPALRPAAAPRGWRLAAALGRPAAQALRTQAVATLGLAPLTLLCFGQLSLVGFAANLLAIPAVTLLITPLALLGLLLPSLWSLGAAALLGLTQALQAMAALPFATWTAAAAPPWAAAAALLGGLVAVAPLPWRLRLCALPLLLPLLAPPPPPPPREGLYELLVADVGQGSAVLLRTRRHLLLYDTGPAWASGSDAGERVLLPLLRARGERRIDALVLSHRDGDHVGGAAALRAALPVAQTFSSLAPGHPLRGPEPAHVRCDAGMGWAWDGVRFEFLHPTPDEHERGGRPNALSCVLRVQDAAGRRLLLAGDIEAAQEAALLRRDPAALRAELLLVPHHGSKSSSTPAFVAAVAPRVALVQAGYLSRYGHPAPEVAARWEAAGAALVRSDRCGAWLLPPGAAPDAGICQRRVAQRYWHHRAGDEAKGVARKGR